VLTAEQAQDYGVVDAVITERDAPPSVPRSVAAQAARQTGD